MNVGVCWVSSMGMQGDGDRGKERTGDRERGREDCLGMMQERPKRLR
jgi:hypothetical protein